MKKFHKLLVLCLIFMGVGVCTPLLGNVISSRSSNLIPRKILFSNPERSHPALSPDGKWLTYLAPHNGVLNIWAQDLGAGKTKMLTHEKKRGIEDYSWAFDSQHVLYAQDDKGDENSKLYKINVQTGAITLLTPPKGVKAKVMKYSYLHPHKILVELNDRDPKHHDIYALDIPSGRKTLIFKNIEFSGFFYDDNFKLIFAMKENARGDTEYYKPMGKDQWKLYRTVAVEDTENTDPLGVDASKQWMYWKDSEGSDKANLVKMHLKTKERKVVFKGQKADLSYALFHPTTKEILATGENYLRWKVTPLTPDMKEDFKILEKMHKGELSIVSASLDHKKWLIEFSTDMEPYSYYLFNRDTKKLTFLFYDRPSWKGLPFVKMQPVEIKSRDGLTLVSYLSLPKNKKPREPVPMLLLVHGGPVGVRHEWELSGSHQYWANRGYAVLNVNYRGSGGFGKNFIKASYGEWGRKMHEDLIDAVNWAVDEKIADPKKIAIVGGSYGGYSALVGASMTPDVFACAIDICGVSDLVTFFDTIPPYWESSYESLKIWLGGDPKTEKGKEFLLRRSPVSYVDNIKNPLLIMHGLNDPRIKKAESDQIVKAMKENGIPVTYLLFPDEGHGFKLPKNKLAEAAAMEAFLAKHLGGELEPLDDEIKQSSMQVLDGAIGN